jgi:glutaconate CoA-transferase subunit A
MTIGVGGWATRRKPMALVRAILRSGLKDLTVVSYGGPDVGMLAAAGKVRKLVFAFVTLDHYPLEPHFRAARQAGAFEVLELDEGMFHWGLRAAAMRLPFLPTRVGIGTDIITQPGFKMIRSPYGDGEELVAMPAIRLDAALIHAHRSDQRGNLLTLSVDPQFDELMVRAADKTYVTVEKIVTTAELDMAKNARFNLVDRSFISGVAEVPFGAHPTSAAPDYELDLKHLKTYVESATSPEAWDDYRGRYVDIDDAAYLSAVGGADAVVALPKPVY